MNGSTVTLALEERAAARRRIAWRRRWAKLGERVGSQVRAFRAKAVLLALQEQLGDLEGIVWPLTLLEGADLTREEIYQALDDLVTEDLIDLDATDTGIYVDSVLRPQQEAEFLAEAAG